MKSKNIIFILKFCLMVCLATILSFAFKGSYINAFANNLTLDINAAMEMDKVPECVSSEIFIWEPKYWSDGYVGYGNWGENWLTKVAPFTKYGGLVTATGGRGQNNWYHEDINGNPIYNFEKLIEATDNILYSGIKPIMVIGNMPNDLSSNGDDYGDGAKWGNRYGPKSWTKYYDYIKALAHELVQKYGTDEISNWKFRLMTEPDNQSWWMESAADYEKLYDYTVAALQSEIGESNLCIGPGNLCNENWGTNGFLGHYGTGTNYYTGTTGTQCNFMSYSVYQTGSGTSQLEQKVPKMMDEINKYPNLGITDWNIGEGGQLSDWENKYLSWCYPGDECGASYYAAIFKEAMDMGISYAAYGNWLSDKYVFDEFDTLKGLPYNVAMCIEKMKDTNRVPITLQGTKSSGNTVDGLASVDPVNNKMYVFIYNNNENRVYSTEELAVNIKNVMPVSGTQVSVEHYRIDENHSNWYTQYENDFSAYPKNTAGFYSVYDPNPIYVLSTKEGLDYWNQKYPDYTKIDELQKYEADYDYTISDNTFSKTISMPGHSVSLLVISNVQSNTGIIKDEMNGFSKMYSHSSNLEFVTDKQVAMMDDSRIARIDTDSQNIVYKQTAIKDFCVTALFDKSEAMNNLLFYKSNDGTTWTPISTYGYSDSIVNGSKGTKRIYQVNSLENTDYIKIEIPSGGNVPSNPQISRAYIDYYLENPVHHSVPEVTQTSAVSPRITPLPPVAPNIALQKAYTSSVAADASYPDTNGMELTDGAYDDAFYTHTNSKWQGRNNVTNYSHILDLGTNYKVKTVSDRFLCQSRHGIYWPENVSISYSIDGTNFTDLGNAVYETIGDVRVYKLDVKNAVEARYIKIDVNSSGGWVFEDEIDVRPEWVDLAKGKVYTSSTKTDAVNPDLNGAALTDGIYANGESGDAQWQGRLTNGSYYQTIDLGENSTVAEMFTDFLQSPADGIKWPDSVSFAYSADGTNFINLGNAVPQPTPNNFRKYKIMLGNSPVTARYIRMTVNASGFKVLEDETEIWGSPFEVKQIEKTSINLARNKIYTTNAEAEGYYLGYPSPNSLTDGIYGGENFRDKAWEGTWLNGKYSQTIDLEENCTVTSMFTNFLRWLPDEIYWPNDDSVQFSYSTDGINFISLGNATPQPTSNNFCKYLLTLGDTPVTARYIRMTVNIAGAWVFEDEMQVWGTPAQVKINLAGNKAYTTKADAERYYLGYPSPGSLTDGIYGGENFRDKAWEGTWLNGKYSQTIDLEKDCTVTSMFTNFLQWLPDEIYWPNDNCVEFSYSTDGINFISLGNATPQPASNNFRKYMIKLGDTPVTARYIRMTVSIAGAWVFEDEMEVWGTKTIVDNTPPITSIMVDGTDKNGWYSSDVKVTLSTIDNISSENIIEYRLGDNGDWTVYTGQVVLAQEGIFNIQYRSTDKAGNVEDIKQENIKIDKKLPEFSLTVNGNVLGEGGCFEDYLPLTFKACDNLSGVATARITIDGTDYSFDPQIQSSMDIDLAGKAGDYNAVITIEDISGNILEKSFLFTVTTSINSMRSLIDRFINSSQLCDPLKVQLANNLDQAQHQLDIGRQDQAAIHMGDFVKHLNNLALGENIDNNAKVILNTDAEALIKEWS